VKHNPYFRTVAKAMVVAENRKHYYCHYFCAIVCIQVVGYYNEVYASATSSSTVLTSQYQNSQQYPISSNHNNLDNSIKFQWGIPVGVTGSTRKRALPKLSPDSFSEIVSSISRSKLLSVTQNAARTLLFRTDKKNSDSRQVRDSVGNDIQQSLHDYSFPAIVRRSSHMRRHVLSQTVDVSTKAISTVQTYVVKPLSRELSQAGIFFGLSPKGLTDSYSAEKRSTKPKRIDLRDGMMEALDELRTMRQEMEQLRKEMHILQKQISKSRDSDEYDDDSQDVQKIEDLQKYKAKRLKEFEKISKDVETWAKQLLFSDQSNNVDWSEIKCSNVLSGKFNPTGATKCYLTYMKDGRPTTVGKKEKNQPEDVVYYDKNEEYPCVKMFSTIDAPLEEVCIYLSNEKHAFDYNSLLQEYGDLEVVSSSSKICWAQTPQILFVKPKDFITYCSHRWLNDDTQIVINHSLNNHVDAETKTKKQANAYAFRGATVIRRDLDNPTTKTQVYMLSHASAGSDIPTWAMRTAIKSLVPIEPFRLFYRMNKGVQESKAELQSQYQQLLAQHKNSNQVLSNDNVDSAEFVSTGVNAPSPSTQTKIDDQQGSESINSTPLLTESKSNIHKKTATGAESWLPGGIAQLGYACFWPAGGGIMEEDSSQKTNKLVAPTQQPQITQDPVEQQRQQQKPASVTMQKRDNMKSSNEVFETTLSEQSAHRDNTGTQLTDNVVITKHPTLVSETDLPHPVVVGPVPSMFGSPDIGNNNNNIIIDRRLAIPAALW
jgi:hypothetical protein